MYRIGTDVGGTFTDGVLLDEASRDIKVSKVSTTPGNPSIGTIGSVELFGVPFKDVSFIVHGTTVVINALLEGKGAKTALLTTKGFRDVLEIGRSNRTEMYNPLYKKPTALVPRYLRMEIKERIEADGSILVPLDLDNFAQVIGRLNKDDVTSVAVCFINAYVNPRHEQEIGKLLNEKYPRAMTSLSHDITRRYYEYERTSTTVQNAYVMPVVRNYLKSLEENLAGRDFRGILQIMQSNGGIMTSAVAKDMPISMVESGPVAGVIGGAFLADMIGYKNVMTYDMGGTTAKTSIIRGGLPETADQYLVERRPILLPVVDICEIGAGGGSIAWIDEVGAMHVGPQSAGAEPGPACYMRGGTDPTVTDADLQLGILNPEYFLGGKMSISPEAGREAMGKIASYYHINANDAALGIVNIVNCNMSGLLQSMTVKQGFDPRDFALIAIGGAGPTHAASIAKELNIPKVIVPPAPGVFSAWGMLMADLRHDFTQTYIKLFDRAETKVINGIFKDLGVRVKELFKSEGMADERIVVSYKIDLRYYGQEHTLSVTSAQKLSDADKDVLARSFDELHLRVYGHNAPEEPKEIVSLSVIGIGKTWKPEFRAIPNGGKTPPPGSRRGKRKVYKGKGIHQEFSIYQRDGLLAENIIEGPAILEEPTSTTVIEKNQTCVVDPFGNLIISIDKEGL